MPIKNKGQALVEFVMLLPVILIILFIIIDFSSVFYKKNHLEGILDDTVSLVQKGYSKEEIINILDDDTIGLTISFSNNLVTVLLEQKVEFITPFSENLFKDGYKISTERVILYE